MENKCIVEKRFLFWKHKVVEHDFKMHRISKFMDTSKHFQIEWRCSKCDVAKLQSFVENDELLLKGISQEILNKVDSFHWHICGEEKN